MVDIFMEDTSFGGAGPDECSGLHTSYTALDTDLQAAFEVPNYPANKVLKITSVPKQEDRDRLRPMICRLYLDENMKLKDVAAVMKQDYDHKASENMYKKRFQKWGIEKNRKSEGMRQNPSRRKERIGARMVLPLQNKGWQLEDRQPVPRAEGSGFQSIQNIAPGYSFHGTTNSSNFYPSTVGAHDKPLEETSAFAEISAQESAVASKSSDIRRPSTRKSAITRRKISRRTPKPNISQARSLLPYNIVRSRSPLREVPPSITRPQLPLILERLFSALNLIMLGMLDRYKTYKERILIPHESRNVIKAGRAVIHNFQDICNTVLSFLRRRLFVEARQLLSKACEKSGEIIAESNPRILSIVFEIYLDFRSEKFGEAATQSIKSMASISMLTLKLKSSCAFRQLFQTLLLVDQAAEEAHLTAWNCYDDIFTKNFQPFHRAWPNSRLDYIEALSFYKDNEDAEMLLRSLSLECEQLCGKLDPRYWDIQHCLAWNLYEQNKYKDAENLTEDILHCIQHTRDKNLYEGRTINIRELLSQSQYRQKKYDLAEENMRQCIHMKIKSSRKDDGDCIYYSLKLVEWLKDWGRQDEAMEIAAKRSQILGSPIIEELLER